MITSREREGKKEKKRREKIKKGGERNSDGGVCPKEPKGKEVT